MTEKEIEDMFKESIAYQYWERVIDDYVKHNNLKELSKLDKYEIIRNLLGNLRMWRLIYWEIEDEVFGITPYEAKKRLNSMYGAIQNEET